MWPAARMGDALGIHKHQLAQNHLQSPLEAHPQVLLCPTAARSSCGGGALASVDDIPKADVKADDCTCSSSRPGPHTPGVNWATMRMIGSGACSQLGLKRCRQSQAERWQKRRVEAAAEGLPL